MRRTTWEPRLRSWGERRRLLLDEVESLTPQRLVAKPLPGKWSILEIVEHLVLADRDVFQGLPDPAQLVDRKRELKDRVSYPITMFMLACHIPVKVASPRMMPRSQLSLVELRRDWEAVGQWLESYLDAIEPEALAKAVFAHPIAGPMTLQQCLHLGDLHLATHTRHIRRLERLTN
jgi:hypothetical protein